MTRRRLPLCLPLLLLLPCLTIPSSTPAAEVGIGLRAGTQGLGAELAFGLTSHVALRGGIYDGDASSDFEEGGIDYEGDLEVGGSGLLVDIFPMGGRFRLTGGWFSNDNQVEIVARPNQDVEIGGTVYTPAQAGTLSGLVDFDSGGPYFGIGWGNVARGKRVGFLFDFGVLEQGSPRVHLESDSPFVAQGDLDQEEREIEQDIEDLEWWPVISFGLAIRF